jgi:hypothetical protein
VATAKQCQSALNRLGATVNQLDPGTRSRHIPQRTVLCRVTDLEVFFAARLDSDGMHDLEQLPADLPTPPTAEVRVTVASDDLVALADGQDDFLSAWLHGRVHVSAPMRDILRLRALVGL